VSASSVAVVGSDATMVYDALRNVVAAALGDLDPASALEDFTVRDVAATSSESVLARVLEALNTPPFLSERRVVVVRDAQSLLSDESNEVAKWITNPAPGVVLVLGVVGTKASKLVKAAGEVVDVNVSSRTHDRVAYVKDKLAEYGVNVDHAVAQGITERVGDDVARVDSLARTLASIFASAPLSLEQVTPYLGDAGDVPEWDLTDAIDKGNVAAAIVVARRMLDSKSRAGLQIVNALQRHYLRMARLEGSDARGDDEAASLLGIHRFPAGKALRVAQRLGPERITAAVHLITNADVDLKGGVSYGGKDLTTDLDATELTVIEVLIARLARLTQGARRR
jgi:DNA polymerase-3 subunit delta